MKAVSLLVLRVSLGLLMVIWGIDKVVNVEHGLEVSKHFYLDLFSSAMLLQVFGALQIALGLAIVLGWMRRFTYPALLLITGATLLGVWRSVIDPWGWYLDGGNVLFYPSLIIFAAAWVLYCFRAEDTRALDRRSG